MYNSCKVVEYRLVERAVLYSTRNLPSDVFLLYVS